MKARLRKMSDKPLYKINAAGGIVFRYGRVEDEPDVLLIFRNNLWDLPKGKAEEGESMEMCAAREVAEETGTSLPAIVSKLGTTYHEYFEEGNHIGKTTWWFSMIYTKSERLEPQTEEGIEKAEWFPVSKALEIIGYDNLKPIIRKFIQQKKAR